MGQDPISVCPFGMSPCAELCLLNCFAIFSRSQGNKALKSPVFFSRLSLTPRVIWEAEGIFFFRTIRFLENAEIVADCFPHESSHVVLLFRIAM